MNDINQPTVMVEAPTAASDDEIDLRQLLGILLAGKWIIAGITATVLALGILYALLATPVYQSNVLLQVNEDNQAYQAGALSDLAASLNGQSPPADTQIAIMTSRSVVGHAVDKLDLAIDAEPDYFPLIGRFIARHYDGDQPASPWLWLSGYAWGGEAIKVTRLNVPREWWNQPLTLMAGAPGRYILYGPEGNRVLKGEVGKPVYANPDCQSNSSTNHSPLTSNPRPDCDGTPSIFVSVLDARPGTRFNLTRRPRLAVIKTLQNNLSVSERGKGTNIVSMSLDGARPSELVSILDMLAQTYVEQNVQNNAQQAQESLKFLRTQLPKVKAQADAAQLALAQYQAQHQALDISADTTSLLAQMVNIQQQISELKLKETEMSERFNAGFPGLQAVRAQIGQMRQIKAKLEDRINNVPKAEQQIFKLKRDVEVNNGLYTALLNQAQQLEVAQAGTVGNARIIDQAALPIRPVKPKRTLIAALSLMLGLMLGAFIVFVRRALAHSVTDPNEVEAIIDQPVYAVIPYSRAQRRAERAARVGKSALPVLAQTQPEDLAVESLRSLRTSLHFALLESHGHVVMMTSPGPGAGKSFSSMNLAALVGSTGQRVLVVDADMRRGYLHEYGDCARAPGLSEVLSDQIDLASAVHTLPDINISLLTTGTIPPNPSELLMKHRFQEFLKDAQRQYDLVILDAPPVLAVTDASLMMQHADALFLVVRSGASSAAEIRAAVKRVQQNHGHITGVLFNGLRREHGQGNAYYYHYSYGAEGR